MFEVYLARGSREWEIVGVFDNVEAARMEALGIHYRSPSYLSTEVRNELGRSIHCFDAVGE